MDCLLGQLHDAGSNWLIHWSPLVVSTGTSRCIILTSTQIRIGRQIDYYYRDDSVLILTSLQRQVSRHLDVSTETSRRAWGTTSTGLSGGKSKSRQEYV